MEDSNTGENPAKVGKAKVISETKKAVLVVLHNKQRWVPKSVIHDDSEVWSTLNGAGELIVKQWWAEKEGLG